MRYIVLLGAPGAGKGTQAAMLSEATGLPHVASGDLFREALQQGTELGLLAKSYMDKGELVPDEVTIRMILERISQPDCRAGCLLDGFPRTLEQAEALDRALGESGEGIERAVHVDVPSEELVERLSGRWLCRDCQTPYHTVSSPPAKAGRCDRCGGELYQRTDDKEETVRERLGVFFAQTVPIIDYYAKQGKLSRVDGSRGIGEVAESILAVLGLA